MQRRYNLAHLILASVIVLVLTPLMVGADPQAQIALGIEMGAKQRLVEMPMPVSAIGGRLSNKIRQGTSSGVGTKPSKTDDSNNPSCYFESSRTGNLEIYVIDADGSNGKGLLTQVDLYHPQRINNRFENRGGRTNAPEIQSRTFDFS